MNVHELAQLIDMPVAKWPLQCYLVVAAILRDGVVDAVPVTGCYHSTDGKEVTDHAWLRLPDGQVFDPSRWVLDDVPPYVYIGPVTANYDEDGTRWEAELQAVRERLFLQRDSLAEQWMEVLQKETRHERGNQRRH